MKTSIMIAAGIALAIAAGLAGAQPPVSFAPAIPLTVGDNPEGIASGDFDGDGAIDLVVANFGSGSVSVLLGNGDGTFRPKTDIPTGTQPWTVAVGDLDGDGRLDLAVPNSGSNTVSVLLGNGDGSFRTMPDIPLPNWPFQIRIGDMNSDGRPDLVLSLAGNISVLLGNGDGTFGPRTDFPLCCPSRLALGDLDGDGNLDVVVPVIFEYSVSVLLGDGTGGFRSRADYPVGINPDEAAIGDLNGDGWPDVAVTSSQSQMVSVFPGNGDGTLGTRVDVVTGAGPECLVIADLNRDGVPDLAAAALLDAAAAVSLGNGDGTFAPVTEFPMVPGTGARSIWAADVNGDGAPDLIVGGGGAQQVTLLLNTATFATLEIHSALMISGPSSRLQPRRSALPLELKVFPRTAGSPANPASYEPLWNSGPGITPPDCEITDRGAVSIGGGTAEDYWIRLRPNAPYFVVGRATVMDGDILTTVYTGCLTDTLPPASFTARDLLVIRKEAGRKGPMVYPLSGGIPVAGTPDAFALKPSQPDPFEAATRIRFDLPASSEVTLHVYNTAGAMVAAPIERVSFAAGSHSVPFDGRGLAPGIYWCRLTAGKFEAVTRMVLLR